MRHSVATILRCTLLTAGAMAIVSCVAFPGTREYFEPNPEDGTPTSFGVCGYHRADSLAREMPGLYVLASPQIVQGKGLGLVLFFSYQGGTIAVDASRIELKVMPSGSTSKGRSVDTQVSSPYAGRPETLTTVTLGFGMDADGAQSVEFVFRSGSVLRSGSAVELAPFRFTKVTKSDFYVNSINC